MSTGSEITAIKSNEGIAALVEPARAFAKAVNAAFLKEGIDPLFAGYAGGILGYYVGPNNRHMERNALDDLSIIDAVLVETFERVADKKAALQRLVSDARPELVAAIQARQDWLETHNLHGLRRALEIVKTKVQP